MREPARPAGKRNIRPREPISVAPATVTQLTCLAILGIDPRRWLEIVAKWNVRRARVGKLVVVALPTMLEALAAHAAEAADDSPTDDEDDGQPQTADAVLAAIGCRRTRGAAA